MFYLFAKYVIGPFIWLFWMPKVQGRRNLAVKGPAIFVANHISMFDALLLGLASPRVVHYMAKAEIFSTVIGNLFYRALFAFPINRGELDIAALRRALQVLKKGKVFGIFPEGKRAVIYEMDKLEQGAAFLALRSGAPVIPAYIHPNSYRGLHPKMYVGEAIDVRAAVEGLPHNEQVAALTNRIESDLLALKVRMEEAG
ncbi:MAG: 1-acyl-sn-glycerol-3-phosphate acyltransferase [Christensenellaceae bacterium]|jgi:1-acyl-sn-glycerol-3-phosphate acyltransferase|nr:1-acyl-sn-glycerol-3-phosphate acyltransferase [Christensenellaceae bacterium]